MAVPLSGLDSGTFCACQHPAGNPPPNPTSADIDTGHACWGVCDSGNCEPCRVDADCDWMAAGGSGLIARCQSGSCSGACPTGTSLTLLFDGGSACILFCVTATDCASWTPPGSCAVPDSGLDAPVCLRNLCSQGCGALGQPCCCSPFFACHDLDTACSGQEGLADRCCLVIGAPCTQTSDCCAGLCSGTCTMGVP